MGITQSASQYLLTSLHLMQYCWVQWFSVSSRLQKKHSENVTKNENLYTEANNQGMKVYSLHLVLSCEPQAKTVNTSVNNIQPIPHRKLSVIYHQHTLSTHNDFTAPTGRKAPLGQQVIHLKLLVLVTIKPRGFGGRKNTPRAISRY